MPCWPVFRAAHAAAKVATKAAAIGVKRAVRRHFAAHVRRAVVKTIVCTGTGAGLAIAVLNAPPSLGPSDPAEPAGGTFLPSAWSPPADLGTFSFDPQGYAGFGGAFPPSGWQLANSGMLSGTVADPGGLQFPASLLPTVRVAALPQGADVLPPGDPSGPETSQDPGKEAQPVPEPGGLVVVLSALGFAGAIRRRRAAARAY